MHLLGHVEDVQRIRHVQAGDVENVDELELFQVALELLGHVEEVEAGHVDQVERLDQRRHVGEQLDGIQVLVNLFVLVTNI